jgi:hypothetical protein
VGSLQRHGERTALVSRVHLPILETFGALISQSLVVPSFKSSEGSHVLASIDAQLERSADMPSDLYWLSVQSEVDPRLLDLVFRHCRRWGSLHFHDPAQVRDRMLHWLCPVTGQLDRLPSELPGKPLLRILL